MEARWTQTAGARERDAIRLRHAPSASATAVDHLYLLRYPWDKSPVKVGRAQDVDARVRQLEAGHNFKLQQLAIFPGQGRLERRVHMLLSDYRATDGRGQEWFLVTPEQAASAATLAIALANPAWSFGLKRAL